MRYCFFLAILFFMQNSSAINSQSFFKDSIATYKTDFYSRARFLKGKYPSVVQGESPIILPPGSDENIPAKIDYLLIPAEKRKNLIIFQSGVHGIEGLAGAGIQNFLLESLHTKNYKNTSFLYVHLVNPWGTFHYRRTNANNVDLNRNFVVQDIDFLQKNDAYATLNFFINPETPFESGFSKKLSFYFESLYLIYKYSIESLRRSILMGQYTFPKGLYYGGSTHQPEFASLKNIWESQTTGYEKVIYIDLHTGYGEKGKLHLLSGHSESEVAKKLVDLFGPTPIDFGNSKNFYETKGDVLTYFAGFQKKETQVYPVTFEFGTLNSQNTLGSLESLYRMRAENRAFHNQSTDDQSSAQVKKLFKDMFYPADFDWRDKVLAQTKNELDKLVSFSEDH